MPVKPALTKEEWGRNSAAVHEPHLTTYADAERMSQSWRGVVMVQRVERRHALAALALHGQSFGFTLFDVQMLREEVRLNRENRQRITAGYIDDLADRIAALLPPEDK